MKKNKTILSKIGKGLKISGITIGSFALLLYVAPYFFKDSINDGIEKLAKNYVKTEVKFKNIDISFYTSFPQLTVTLNDTSIKGTNPFETENLLSAKEISLGIDLKSLFGDKISFNKLVINQADIRLLTDYLGQNNYNVLVSSDDSTSKEDSSIGLDLDNISIVSSTFLYDDKLSEAYLKFEGFNYNGDLDFKNNVLSLDADAKISKVNFLFEKENYIKNLKLNGKLKTAIDLNSLSFQFNKTELALDQFKFILDGSMRLGEEEKDFDIKLHSVNNDLKYLPKILPESYQEWAKDIEMKGYSELLLTFKGVMNGKLNKNPDLHLGINIKDGFLNYKNSPTPIKNLNLISTIDIPVLDPNQLKVVVEDLTFNLLEGNTKTNFTYWAGDQLYSEGNITSAIDLKALKNATGFKKIDGRGKLDLNGNWKGSLIYDKLGKIQKIPTFNLKGVLANGYLKLDQMPEALDEIHLNAEIINKDGILEHTSVFIHHVDAKSLQNYVEGSFKVDDLKRFPIDADFKAKIKLEDIYRIYPLEGIDLRGDLLVNLKAKGVYDFKTKKIPQSNAVLNLTNGYIRLAEYPNLPLENIKVETHVKSTNGTFKDLAVDILPIQFTLSGKPFMVRANLKNFNSLDYRIFSKGELNLAKIYQLFPIEGLDLEGVIETNFGIQGKEGKDLTGVKNKGFIKIENIKINSEYFPHKFTVKEGTFKFNGKDLVFKDVKARYKKNNFLIDGIFSDYMNFALNDNAILKGQVNFTSNRVNVDDFMAFNSVNSTVSSGVVLLPENMNLALTGKVKKVLYRNLNLENFEGELDLNNGTLILKSTNFDMIGSKFSMNGDYKPINAKKAKFNINAKANNFDIQRAYKEIQLFRDLASVAENAYGKVSMDYHLDGYLGADMFPKLKTIKGGGTFVLEDIKFKGFKVFNSVSEKTSVDALYNAKFNQVEVKSEIADNVITIDRTKFKVSGFRLRVEGQVTLDGYMNLGMRLGLPPLGIIGIPIKVTGPSDTFKVEVGKYKEEDLDESDEENPTTETIN